MARIFYSQKKDMPENPTNIPENPEPRSSSSLSPINDQFDPNLDFDIEILDTMSFQDQIIYMENISLKRQELHNKNTPPL